MSRTIVVQIYEANRAFKHVEIAIRKSRFLQITVFLYNGLWQTHFSRLEKWFRYHFEHFMLALLARLLRLFGPRASAQGIFPFPWLRALASALIHFKYIDILYISLINYNLKHYLSPGCN